MTPFRSPHENSVHAKALVVGERKISDNMAPVRNGQRLLSSNNPAVNPAALQNGVGSNQQEVAFDLAGELRQRASRQRMAMMRTGG